MRLPSITLLLLSACMTAGGVPLAGTEWDLVELNGQPSIRVSGERRPHIRFEDESRLSGSGGCNRFSGPYERSGSQLRVTGPVISTKMACADRSLNAQETAFLGSLDRVATYTVSGRTLTFYAQDGTEIAELTSVE